MVNKGNWGVAFDTQTGQLCRTWDWEPMTAPKYNKEGSAPQDVLAEFSPTCLSIYQDGAHAATASPGPNAASPGGVN